MPDTDPGTALTSQQMQEAPRGAIYVCPDENYARLAAEFSRSIGRSDLCCVSTMYLERGRWDGAQITGVVVDHACRLNSRQQQGYSALRCHIRPEVLTRPAKAIQTWPSQGPTATEGLRRRLTLRQFYEELGCLGCQRGHLIATGVTHERGLVHACSNCGARFEVPGAPYPRRVEEIDPHAPQP